MVELLTSLLSHPHQNSVSLDEKSEGNGRANDERYSVASYSWFSRGAEALRPPNAIAPSKLPFEKPQRPRKRGGSIAELGLRLAREQGAQCLDTSHRKSHQQLWTCKDPPARRGDPSQAPPLESYSTSCSAHRRACRLGERGEVVRASERNTPLHIVLPRTPYEREKERKREARPTLLPRRSLR
ncbi:hypothetical protein BCR35DRAFT_113240 [Leucosporidium creatinivorum]|uniref:Uncharacterized protein n=1 Tax=Leucosporidium creatinivorum TaxID=106004 RepID=A0A1Y2F3R0_9BASI|nr:hypothetical protein BCR35DRAFT_113240 [Leucosporidium creatinivorum]